MPEERVSRDLEPRLVFVYGTLRRGGANDINNLLPAPAFRGTARVRGRLFDLGAYPGLLLASTPDEVGKGVSGEVYAIDAALERQLDVIEEIRGQPDDEYFRRQVLVKVGGQSCTCLVYEINPSHVAGGALIDHGDWMRYAGTIGTGRKERTS